MGFNEIISFAEPLVSIVAIVGAVLLFMGVTKKGKTKQSGQAMLLVGIVGLAVALFAPQILTGFGGTPAAVGSTAVGTGLTGLCAVEDTTVTFSSFNKFTAAATGGTHAYKIDGGARNTVADAATQTLSPGDNIEILWLNEGNTAGYFGEVSTVQIPCKGTFNIEQDLVQNGTITINVFNEEGNLIDGGAENETLGTGDVANLKIEIRASNEQGYPHGGILTLELNGTDFDEENTVLTFGDLTVTEVATPTVHTITNTANKVISWELSAFDGAQLHIGTLILDVDTNNNPGDTNDPVLTWRPNDFFVDQDTGNSFEGPAAEDEDNAATVNFAPTTTISVD